MLLKRSKKLVLIASIVVGSTACSDQTFKSAQEASNPTDQQDEFGNHLLSGEEADAEAEAADENATDSVSSDTDEQEKKGHEVFRTAQTLSQQIDMQVAVCGGFGAEASALMSKMEELKAAGVKREDARDDIEPLKIALQEKMLANKDLISECIKTARASGIGSTLKDLVDSCMLKQPPPRRDDDRKGPKQHQGKGKKGKGKGKGKGKKDKNNAQAKDGDRPHFKFPPLPPREQFESVTCQAALVVAKDLLGVTEENNDSDTAESGDEPEAEKI